MKTKTFLTLAMFFYLASLPCQQIVGKAVAAQAQGKPAAAQVYVKDGKVRVALVKMPYSGARNVEELSDVPDYLEQGGIKESLERAGANLKPIETVALTPEERKQYGEWHRMGLANGHLAEMVSRNYKEGFLSVGLLANCTSLLGVLGGLQHSGADGRLKKVALVFIDAHGDFNTPETTLSGMLGGMPVAVSAGLALKNLRLKSKLEPPLPTANIVLAAARDLDPLERELIDKSEIQKLTVADIRSLSPNLHQQMRRLSEAVDIIYVHVDMDVLDPKEVPGHPLTVPDGPTSRELAAALTEMFKYDKVAALGIASTPANERDPEGVSRRAAYNLIEGALKGVRQRSSKKENR
ncbi:MAG: arginase family protein [Blastocatellia bacterium]|nr:arginase family protein [Blastocatellia bacterium]